MKLKLIGKDFTKQNLKTPHMRHDKKVLNVKMNLQIQNNLNHNKPKVRIKGRESLTFLSELSIN